MLFLNQSFDQLAVVTARCRASQQQLGVGPQGCQWVAQLMQQGPQLVLLLGEFNAQSQGFKVQHKGVGQTHRHLLQALFKSGAPSCCLIKVHTQGSEDGVVVLQGEPSALGGGPTQVCIAIGRRKLLWSCWPLADQIEHGLLLIRSADVQTNVLKASDISTAVELALSELQKAWGQLHGSH